jgi:hypothetical protein
MSDALTDIARDETRSQQFEEFLHRVHDYLLKPHDLNRASAQEAAKAVDSIPRGYWGGQTDLYSGCGKFLDELIVPKPEAWGRLLLDAKSMSHDLYCLLQQISPWPDKKMQYLDFNWRNLDNGFEGMIREAMHQAGNGTCFSGNPSGWFRYVIFYDQQDTLETMARSAVCIGIQRGAYVTGGTTYIMPTSHRLDYLEQRRKMFERQFTTR